MFLDFIIYLNADIIFTSETFTYEFDLNKLVGWISLSDFWQVEI